MTRRMRMLLTVGLTCAGAVAQADVNVDKMFGDRMVLQRDMAVPVWGTGDAGERVTVLFRGQSRETVVRPIGSDRETRK